MGRLKLPGLAKRARADACQAVKLYALGAQDIVSFSHGVSDSTLGAIHLLRQILESAEPETPKERQLNSNLLLITRTVIARKRGLS